MYKKITPTELKHIPLFEQKIKSDGYSYINKIYTPRQPIQIELTKDNNNTIKIEQKIITIQYKTFTQENTYQLTLTQQDNTKITITYDPLNTYKLNIKPLP